MCGRHDNHRHNVSRSGSLIGLQSVARLGLEFMSLGADGLSGSYAVGFEERSTV